MSAQVIELRRLGATQEEWDHFTLILGLTADLLPVVSDPKAIISGNSKMKAVGKTPSQFNQQRHVAGIANWTSHVATDADIQRWCREPDYGVCIQTRHVRALDVDIDDLDTVNEVLSVVNATLDLILPRRTRSNANKFLLAFRLEGEYSKRILRTAHGNVEALMSGQQFVAAGTHPSGERYTWAGGLPEEIPTITSERFEQLWRTLEERFAVETSTTTKTSTKAAVLADATQNDPVAKFLSEKGWVRSNEKDGRLHIRCPWQAEHSTESADSATTYFPAHTGGYDRGTYYCMHAHCSGRTQTEFQEAIGYHRVADEFAAVDSGQGEAAAPAAPRFQLIQAADFATRSPLSWLVKGVLPAAELIVVYGESTSGKSFFTLDILIAVARGLPWRHHITTKGRCVYVVAEGAGGFQNRLKAWAHVNQTPLSEINLYVLGDAPNLMLVPDVKALIAAINAHGPVSCVVVDTLAQVMIGGEENSATDMGKVVAHCKAIHKHTGATVILIHHSGKNSEKGARGSSALRAAADAELEIVRSDEMRVASVTKIKDGQDGSEFGFRLQTVLVGEDEDGEDITSCVVEHVAAETRRARTRQPKGTNEKAVMRAARGCMGLDGGSPKVNDVIEAAVAMLTPPEEGKRDKRREHVVRALDGLVTDGALRAVEGGMLEVAQ